MQIETRKTAKCRSSCFFEITVSYLNQSSFLRVTTKAIPETANNPSITVIASEPVFGLAFDVVVLFVVALLVDTGVVVLEIE